MKITIWINKKGGIKTKPTTIYKISHNSHDGYMPENEGGFVPDLEDQERTTDGADVPSTASSIDDSSHNAPKDQNTKWTPEEVETEARAFLLEHGDINGRLLKEAGMNGLDAAVYKVYPDRMNGLRIALGLDIVKKHGYWTLETIEDEARKLLVAHGTLNTPLLERLKRGDLEAAITVKYPGGITALREKLGQPRILQRERPRNWVPEITESEANKFIQDHGNLSAALLRTHRRNDLLTAITSYYPGGLHGIKVKLGLESEKELGEWTIDKIEAKALEVFEQHGYFTVELLQENRMWLFYKVINDHYPGKWHGLCQNLGIDDKKKPKGYWTEERIEASALAFYEEHKTLSQNMLTSQGSNDLSIAITRKYPGGMAALKEKLKLPKLEQKPNRYWLDSNNILSEAKAFLAQYGDITSTMLKRNGGSSLLMAITKHYRGGILQLRKELGLQQLHNENGNWASRITHTIQDLADSRSEASQHFSKLLSIFGNSNAIDILFATHPEFKGIPVEKVKKIIGGYLGDFLATNRVFNPESLKGATEHLSQPSLREGLTYIIKNDCLAFYNRNKKAGSHRIDSQLIQEYFDILMLEFEDLESDDAETVLLESLQYYDELLALEHPSSMVTNLREGRSFPDLNQRINIKELMDKKRMLIADEMGLGKSASAILTKETMQLKNCLIVSPSNVVSTWQTYLSSQAEGGYFVDGKAPRVLVIEDVSQLEGDITSYDYVIISQERLNTENTNFLTQFHFDMMIVDEVHKLKNLRGGKRSQSLLQLSDKMDREEGVVAMLSGTPVPNKIEDVALILKMLYPERFEAIPDKQLVSSIINGDIVDLRNLLLPRMQMKSLTESLDLPELTETTEIITLQGISREVYDVLMEEDELTSTEKIQILRKYLLNPRSVDTTPNVSSDKLVALQAKLDSHFATHSKAVMFVNDYVQDVIRGETTIFDSLTLPEGVRVEIIDGSTNKADRQRIQRELNTGNDRMFVVVSGDTADVGIDLTGAEASWTYNEPWTKYDKRQQLARVYREGLDHPLESTTFITRDTIEEGINKYIAIKERAIEKLLKGIPLSEIEEEMLRRSEESVDDDLSVNKELAEYYFSSWDRMMKMFAHVKEIGEKDFNKFLEDYGREYADCYTELGSRSYQANASRLSGTLIDTFVRERQQDPSQVRILDIASGPEMLRKHALDQYSSRIFSMDINKHHFAESNSKQQVVGSFLNLPFAEKSFDYANLALAWHYTNFAPSKDNYERLEVLAQANRVLKEKGRLVISNIYTRNLKDEQKFREIVGRIGFQTVGHYTGEVGEGESFNSHVYTLQKIADVPEAVIEDPASFAEELGKDLLQGVKFDATTRRLKDTRRIMTQFTINGTSLPIQFNEADQANLDEERRILAAGEALKAQYGSIRDIPAEAIMAENYVRLRVKNKYILFKKLSSSNGAVVIR